MLDPVATSRLTRHYQSMRGLVFLPLTIGFGLGTVFNGLGWTRTSSWEELSIFGLSILATVPFSRYYRRRFGVVRPLIGDGRFWMILAFFVVFVLQGVAVKNRFPIEPLLLFFAAYFAWIAIADGGYRKHWAVPAVACFLLSIRGFVPLDRSTSHILFGAVSAATVALACIRDHIVLVRSFRDAQA